MTPSLSACSARRTNFSSADSGVAVDGTSQGASVVKKPAASVGGIRDVGSTPGSGRSPGGGNGTPLQYSCLETWTEEPGGLQCVGSHRVRQDRSNLAPGWCGGFFFFFCEEGVNSHFVIFKSGLYVCETSENFRGAVWSGE